MTCHAVSFGNQESIGRLRNPLAFDVQKGFTGIGNFGVQTTETGPNLATRSPQSDQNSTAADPDQPANSLKPHSKAVPHEFRWLSEALNSAFASNSFQRA